MDGKGRLDRSLFGWDSDAGALEIHGMCVVFFFFRFLFCVMTRENKPKGQLNRERSKNKEKQATIKK